MKTKLLIDGDILVYRLGFAAQTRNGQLEPPANAVHLVKKCIKDMCRKFGTDNIKVYLTSTDRSNYRYQIAKTKVYKGSRDPAINPKAPEKPIYYNTLRRYLLGYWNAENVTGQEADDALGIHQMRHINDPYFTTIICTIDKDLDQIPGDHYNFVTDKLYKCTDEDDLVLTEHTTESGNVVKKMSGGGIKWFYAQMLMGDKADDIPGIPGLGPMKVIKLLKGIHGETLLWKSVQAIYLDKLSDNMDDEDIYDRLYEVADLLWMRRVEGEFKSGHLKELGRI